MSSLIGITSIFLVTFITIIIGLRYRVILNIILVALTVRVFLILVGHYLIDLPDSTADSVSFESEAWRIAQYGFDYLITDYNFAPSAKFISWVVAIPYSLIGRSALMAKSLSLLLGMGCVFLGWKVAKMIWDEKIAKKVAWVIALFPSLVLYSVLVMRESYVSFFLLVAMYGVVKWVKTKSLKSLAISILGFVAATFFHGAMMIGALTFIIIIGSFAFIKFYKLLLENRINFKILFILIIFLFSIFYYISGNLTVPYLGSFDNTSDLDNLLTKANNSTRGDASFPNWLKIFSASEFIYKGPIRSLYFLFSPFPWDVRQPHHLIGLLDSFLYIYLVFLIFCNRKVIFEDPVLSILLIILVSYVIVFSVGVGNFGTGIRHRSKFAIMFILLAAPLIKSFVIFKK